LTRRILLALLALTMSVLVAAVIPLGFKATSYALHSYVDDARAMTRSAAAVAEEQLADGRPSPNTARVLAAARRGGDSLVILNARRQIVASAGPRSAMPAGLVSEAVAEREVETKVGGKYVAVAVPVRDTGPVVGAVALARPLAPLHDRIRDLWLTLALIAAAAIGASAVLAFALARWVSKPLAELEGSARRLGTGDLTARAPATTGPPELRRLATSFNAMASRLETLVRGHRAMVADVSHQLRTPLAALRLRLDLLAQDADPATAAELAGGLEEFARLSRLVDGLLAVAKAENTVPRPTAVDVGEVIRDRVQAWQPVAADRGVRLTASAGPTGPIAAAIGEGHLEQILDNLIANAIDTIASGGNVTVSARARGEIKGHAAGSEAGSPGAGARGNGGAPGDREAGGAGGVRVVVADDGPGMSAEDRSRAFGRFTTASPGGTGLGLAIVHRLVTSNGGTATLEETPGGGLSVVLDLRAAVKTKASSA
jgi:signal transduction histidine kinase